jgi:hypothetical protein
VKIDVSEGIDPDLWPDLPSDDRLVVGGHTFWIGPFRPPVVVAQPNRWGVVESRFPNVPCIVECDPAVIAELPLPDEVMRFVDRAHRPITAEDFGRSGAELMRSAARLANRLTQIPGVSIVARPFARSIPIITPREASWLAERCAEAGIVGLRPLRGIGGAVILSVGEDQTAEDHHRIVEALSQAITG